MTRPIATRTLLLTLLCVMLLAVRIGGAHLHFCFDGQEPAASFHLLDVDPHRSPGMHSEHHDYDVMIGEQSLVKSGKAGFDLPVFLLPFLALVLLPRAAGRAVPAPDTAAPLRAPAFLRPPTRGPPSLSSL